MLGWNHSKTSGETGFTHCLPRRAQCVARVPCYGVTFAVSSAARLVHQMQTPAGKTVRVPVTKIPRITDKLQYMPLSLPSGPRLFVPLMLLREGEVFVRHSLCTLAHLSPWPNPVCLSAQGGGSLCTPLALYSSAPQSLAKACLSVCSGRGKSSYATRFVL